MSFFRESNCRACGNELESVFDLGNIYPSTFLDGEASAFVEPVPLILARCKHCQLVQLKHTVDLDLMYKQWYWYKSSLNKSMREDLHSLAKSALMNARLQSGDIVVDIGANDGTLLSYYAPFDLKRVGFDPASNIAEEAARNCDVFINDYFTDTNYPFKKKAKIVTSVAMFYDLPHPPSFVEGVRSILHEDGIWILQMTDLTSMLRVNAFDNINHEHLEYYTLNWLVDFISTFCLDVFRAEYNQVNGSSLRLYVCHTGKREIDESVPRLLEEERAFLNLSHDPLCSFKERIYTAQMKITNKLMSIFWEDQIVYGMAASTKGNTLLQAWGIDSQLIRKIADVNPDKFGRRTIGSNIEIISDEQAMSENPDYYFVLAWHFIGNFLERYRDYLERGGKFIVPLPEPRIYYLEGEEVRWTSL